MGTRGTYGFRLDEKDFLTYNHFDSYPDGLGNDVVVAIRNHFSTGGSVSDLADGVRNMYIVQDESDTPTPEEFERFEDFWEDVSTGRDWYSLLRNMQGDIMKHLDVGIMINGNSFIQDSLFCEYGYIINLDEEVLEVYRGFQSTLHNKGRYGGEVDDPQPYHDGSMPPKYYGCALVGSFPLDNIPDDWAEQAFGPDEDE